MKTLYKKARRVLSRTLRCYLTLRCSLKCYYCSAGIPRISIPPREIHFTEWVAGINKKNRPTILAGGEPFLYKDFTLLLSKINPHIKVEIYTNLSIIPTPEIFLDKKLLKPYYNIKRNIQILASLHDSVENKLAWIERAKLVIAAGYGFRIHVIKVGNYIETCELLKKHLPNIKCNICDDQTAYIKSQPQIKYPYVNCVTKGYYYGPDGHRYTCITKMGMRAMRLESINAVEEQITTYSPDCPFFGNCVGCDNNIEGEVTVE